MMWGSQLGKTEMELNLIGYLIDRDPGPALMIQPTLAMAEAVSKERIAPMFRDTPALLAKVAGAKGRDAGSTIFSRTFRGGQLSLVGSNSPAGLASRPIRYLLMDEIDRWERSAGAEGDPASLAIARTTTFWNRKIAWTSSPTDKGASKIADVYELSDQRRYWVPCPHCEKKQVLKWSQVEWPEGKPLESVYRCEHCEQKIEHHKKAWMLNNGEWIADNPDSTMAGFWLSSLYSPWFHWGKLAEEWIGAQGDPEKLKTFINTRLCELWDDTAQGSVSEQELMDRRETVSALLPEQVAIITAGVDVQPDRFEVSVWGWGRGEESWLLEHQVIAGDILLADTQARLDEYLLKKWAHPVLGELPIRATCIDSGFGTEHVCNFAIRRRGRNVWAIKGDEGPRPIWPKKESKARKGNVFIVGVDSCKATITGRLKSVKDPGQGFIHLPVTIGLGYIEQLCSEFLKTDYRRGRPVRHWQRKKGRAAEALDSTVYAYAAVYGLRAYGVHIDVVAGEIENMKAIGTRRNETPATSVKRESSWIPKRTGWFSRG